MQWSALEIHFPSAQATPRVTKLLGKKIIKTKPSLLSLSYTFLIFHSLMTLYTLDFGTDLYKRT